MRTRHLLLVTWILYHGTVLHAQAYQWAKSIGGTQGEQGNSIAVDAKGNVYTTGHFEDTVDFDPGPGEFKLISAGVWDAFVSKLDAKGNFLWAKRLGGTDDDENSSIVVDRFGNVYTIGSFKHSANFGPDTDTTTLTSAGSHDVLISKLNTDGNFVWVKRIGGIGDDYGRSIVVDNRGNISVTGSFYSTVDFDPGIGTFSMTSSGFQDAFIAKLDPNGNLVWADRIGGKGADVGYCVALDSLQSIYVTGFFEDTITFDPGATISKMGSKGKSDIYIAKLDASGKFIWAKTMGGTEKDYCMSVAIDNTNHIYTTGYFEGTADFDPGPDRINLTSVGSSDIFVSKLDSNGDYIWAKQMAGTDLERSSSIAVDVAGNVYTTGYFWSSVDFDPGPESYPLTSAGSTEIFISKLNTNGEFVWAKSIGSFGIDQGSSIAIDNTGGLYLTGVYQSTVNFGIPSVAGLVSNGSTDIFIAKYTSSDASVSDREVSKYLLYPNPTNNRFSVDLGKQHQTVDVFITDALGRVISRHRYNNSSVLDLEINGTVGVYFLMFRSGKQETIIRIVKQ